jgi:hypothetical protein
VGILSIDDTQGNGLYRYSSHASQVIDPDIARKISDVLSDNAARAPAFGENSFLKVADREVAVKTGTTNDYRDAWIIGYTPSIVVGAWAGNNDNTPMQKKVAGFIIAPLWNAFFMSASTTLLSEHFPSPSPTPSNLKPALRGIWYGGETYKVDRISGKLATDFTPNNMIEERVLPNPHEILFWVNKNDPLGPAPQNPYDDPQYLLWEIPAEKWVAENGLPPSALMGMPQGSDDIHNPLLAPKISITSPVASTTYGMNEKLVIHADVAGSFTIARVDIFFNNTFVGSMRDFPYDFSFVPSQIGVVSDANIIRVTAYDIVGNSSSIDIPLSFYGGGTVQ